MIGLPTTISCAKCCPQTDCAGGCPFYPAAGISAKDAVAAFRALGAAVKEAEEAEKDPPPRFRPPPVQHRRVKSIVRRQRRSCHWDVARKKRRT